MNTPDSTSASESPTVRIERWFDFPREAVFDAWTTPAILARWFAPRGCTLSFVRIDVRVGGGFHSCIDNPSFGSCWTVADFREVTRPSRITFDWRSADANGLAVSPESQGHPKDWPAETRVTVTFEEKDGGTRVILEQNVSEAVAKRTGAHPSWLQMLDILDETLAQSRHS
jgi:uncharacterized protein YndB with AHSA1/START domain